MSEVVTKSHPTYPTAYPSPSTTTMVAPSSQYSSYPLPESQGPGNAQAGVNNMQALNLPPIRSGDGGSQAQQPPPPAQQPHPQPGQVSTQSMQYYIPPGQPYSTQPGDPNALMRFGSIPIPPADSRIMSGGRHKKEIKRRTKTGCLTCRKRRIKCDEQHPACRNCQKSKRDCLGYDPIFKPQPGPPPIQPALGAAPLHHPSHHPSYPPGYPGGYPGYPPQPLAPERSTSEANDYSAAIDPALGGMAQAGGGEGEQGGHRAKRTKIEDLLCISGFAPPPPTPSQPIPDPLKDQMKQIWSTVYAPGIDKFLETTWYVSRGEANLLANQKLCEQFVSLIYRFQAIPQNDPNYPLYLAATYSLEAKVIWQMISMCRAVARPVKSEGAPEPEVPMEDVKNGVNDAVTRLEIFEALVTGEYLSSDNAPPSTDENKSNGTALGDQFKTRELQFWNLTHTFLTIRDDEASAAKEIDDTISSARSLLDSRENRDVIYSIMIARHIGARIAEFPDNLPQPTSNEEADNKNKLHVAKRFIEDEANGKGTNQIVQRLCGMAARSWGPRR